MYLPGPLVCVFTKARPLRVLYVRMTRLPWTSSPLARQNDGLLPASRQEPADIDSLSPTYGEICVSPQKGGLRFLCRRQADDKNIWKGNRCVRRIDKPDAAMETQPLAAST